MQVFINKIRASLSALYTEQEIHSLVRLLIEHVTGQSLPLLLSDKNTKITIAQKQKIEEIVERLQRFEPLQYILGETEFYGLTFSVDTNVLIPRPETEELVELIISENEKRDKLRILDIGTGSGAIAVALKKHLRHAAVEAWDISQQALNVALVNAEKNGVDILFRQVDVLNDFPKGRMFDVIVSNPPYVMDSEKKEISDNVLDYEPHTALFVSDENPLLFYDRITDLANSLLVQGGRLYFEINQKKGLETVAVLEQRGFVNVQLIKDLMGNDRIVKGELPL